MAIRIEYVRCISNIGYEVSLEVGRRYRILDHLPGELGELNGLYRVIDESGEDYLYPQELFETDTIKGEG